MKDKKTKKRNIKKRFLQFIFKAIVVIASYTSIELALMYALTHTTIYC